MQKYFSSARLNAYNNSYKEYIRNIHESQRIYLKLHMFEITIRNRIDKHFTNVIGVDWLMKIHNDLNNAFVHRNPKKKKYNVSSFDLSKSTVGFFVGNLTYSKIDAAVMILNKTGKRITHDSIMGALTLGFWSGIFENSFLKNYRSYNSVEYDTLLIDVIGVNRALVGSQSEIARIETELKDIRDFRNRVYHYEKITHIIINVELLIDKYLMFFDDDGKLIKFIDSAKNQEM